MPTISISLDFKLSSSSTILSFLACNYNIYFEIFSFVLFCSEEFIS